MEHAEERRRAARGSYPDRGARTSDGTPPRPAWLRWTDPETGDRLRVELWSSEAFLAGLVAAGFELYDGSADAKPRGPEDPRGRTGGKRARSSAGDRAGSAPPGDAA